MRGEYRDLKLQLQVSDVCREMSKRGTRWVYFGQDKIVSKRVILIYFLSLEESSWFCQGSIEKLRVVLQGLKETTKEREFMSGISCEAHRS